MLDAQTYAAVKRDGGLCDLSARAKLRLTGADRVRFLNGQTSKDIRRASATQTLAACVMTAKGKMCADIHVFAGADFLQMDADASLAGTLAARLERYIISDDVELVDVTDALSLFHIFGVESARAAELIGALSAAHPSASILGSRRLGSDGIDIVVESDRSGDVWAWLSRELPTASDAVLECLRVEAGVPKWGCELTEDTIPVEAGLDRHAIDYGKGCYVGQEVISRLKSIGQVNKRLLGFVAIEGSLQPGMRLFSQSQPEKDAGWLTTVARSFGLEKQAALGYLKRGFEPGLLNARDPDNPVAGGNPCVVEARSLPLIP